MLAIDWTSYYLPPDIIVVWKAGYSLLSITKIQFPSFLSSDVGQADHFNLILGSLSISIVPLL